jgi:GNAT superfamily N-acetyltransferase
MDVRTADRADCDALVELLTAAFRHDPLWRWAFPDPAALEVLWRFYIESALRYPCVWIADDYAAAAVWIPPGGVELTHEEEQQVETVLRELTGAHAPAVLELLARFEAAHPQGTPHYYLTLLGVDPERRGRGIGMALLAENLALMDDEGVPAYLESSNPANDLRYQAVGFEPVGSFTTPDGERTVTTMWRDIPDDGASTSGSEGTG